MFCTSGCGFSDAVQTHPRNWQLLGLEVCLTPAVVLFTPVQMEPKRFYLGCGSVFLWAMLLRDMNRVADGCVLQP